MHSALLYQWLNRPVITLFIVWFFHSCVFQMYILKMENLFVMTVYVWIKFFICWAHRNLVLSSSVHRPCTAILTSHDGPRVLHVHCVFYRVVCCVMQYTGARVDQGAGWCSIVLLDPQVWFGDGHQTALLPTISRFYTHLLLADGCSLYSCLCTILHDRAIFQKCAVFVLCLLWMTE